MKITNYKLIPLILLAVCSVAYAAKGADDEIELPDVTTLISGDSLIAGKDSVPDYKDVLPDIDTAKIQLPLLKSDGDDKNAEKQSVKAAESDKDIYAQGKAGGGFPFCFTGDFSVYRASGNAPFSMNLSHSVTEAIADKKAIDGYYFRSTAFNAEKTYTGSALHNIKAGYDFIETGLQGKSLVITDMISHTVSSSYDAYWGLPGGFNLSYGAFGEWYTRYGNEYSDGSFVSYLKSDKKANVFVFNPDIKSLWTNDIVTVSFDCDYKIQGNLASNDTYVRAPGSYSAQSSHRGQFTLKSDVMVSVFDIYGSVSALVGTHIGDNNALVPFTVGVKIENTSQTISVPFTFDVSGGLTSYQLNVSEYEKKYRFASLPCIPSDVTNWYCKADFSFPIRTIAEAGVNIEYSKTAFGNGEWSSVYGSDLTDSGVYLIKNNRKTYLNTDLFASVIFNDVRLNWSWTSYWLDTSAIEYKHCIKAGALYQKKGSLWSTGVDCDFGLGNDFDNTPCLNAYSQVVLTKALRMSFEVNDVIKLVSNETRRYADSQYKQESGSASLFLKFQF